MSQTDYHEDTALLIERMCQAVERKSYRLQKAKAEECLMQTYDLFGLPRPKKVVWGTDIFDEKFASSASSARSARSASSAWSASSARSAWSARSASSARSARSARSAWSARSASSARSAWSARSASSARSARSALDYDFNHFVFGYEYYLNPTDDRPNDGDRKYLAYAELLLRAIECGASYRVEWDDTLYIVPAPLVLLDEQNRFHSEDKPAIRWKGGQEFYYLRGENFDKPLWQKISDKTITAAEVMKIADTDKRTIAMSLLPPNEMIKQLRAKLIHTGIKGNRLYECKNFMDTGKTEYALLMDDASTPRQFIKFIRPEYCGEQLDADYVTARHYQDAEGDSLPLEDYLAIEHEA